MTLVIGTGNSNNSTSNTSIVLPYPHTNDYTLLAETAKMHASPSVARFIEQEVARPSKQWIANIIDGKQEVDEVVCRTPDFVLLPDTERVNRYWRAARPLQQQAVARPHNSKRILNWLAIAHDKQLRTIRDLRGQHVPMLREMLDTCMFAIESETGIRRDQVMAYVHYPPSVYQLHVHFSYPYGQYCHRDAYRVHNLAAIINNLEIDPDYYAKATLHMAIYRQSLHFSALTSPGCGRDLLASKSAKEGDKTPAALIAQEAFT
jgi:m7GpppX diphosphatase